MQRQPETLDADVTVSCCATHQTPSEAVGDVTDQQYRVGLESDERHPDFISGDSADTENWCDTKVKLKVEGSDIGISSSQSAQLHAVDTIDKVMSIYFADPASSWVSCLPAGCPR